MYNLYDTEKFDTATIDLLWAVVVTQLVEQSIPTPEVRWSNPVIGKNLYWTFVYYQLYWKDENKEKETVNCQFKKQWFGWLHKLKKKYDLKFENV